MMKHQCLVLALCVPLFSAIGAQAPESGSVKPVRVAIAGLVHPHVHGFLRVVLARRDIQIVGIFEPDTALQQADAKRYGIADAAFFTDLAAMLEKTKPDAVAVFTNTYDHAMVVAAAAPRHLAVMMEKPLAVSMEHARAIQRASTGSKIPIIVNYDTTWYPSHGAIWRLIEERRAIGEIRKMVAMDGHPGPKEIGTSPESFGWLTDPVQNGAGALFDFGCYGANVMTWLMHNQRPTTVTAITHQNKPDIYPHVDDEATILLQYPKAQGIIQASWNWPFGRKDLEVYGERGLVVATGREGLRMRLPNEAEHTDPPEPLPADAHDSLAYLIAVVRGQRIPTGLSSLENNMVVTEILESARESARTGRTVSLPAAPAASSASH
jgi:predicted dehydrogenase